MDGSGIHCGVSFDYFTDILSSSIDFLPTKIQEDNYMRKKIGVFLEKAENPNILRRIFIKIYSIWLKFKA